MSYNKQLVRLGYMTQSEIKLMKNEQEVHQKEQTPEELAQIELEELGLKNADEEQQKLPATIEPQKETILNVATKVADQIFIYYIIELVLKFILECLD